MADLQLAHQAPAVQESQRRAAKHGGFTPIDAQVQPSVGFARAPIQLAQFGHVVHLSFVMARPTHLAFIR